jgi:dolichol-phosphate mannosyltransferase
VGGLGVVVNAGMLYVLTEIGRIDYRVSSIFAIESAIIHNFILNYLWTFRERRTSEAKAVLFMFVKFNLSSSLTAMVVNWGTLVVLTEFMGIYYLTSNVAGIVLGTCANFLMSRYWAFSHPAASRTGAV